MLTSVRPLEQSPEKPREQTRLQIRATLQQQQKYQEQTYLSQINLDGMKYELMVKKKICQLPEQLIVQDDNNTTWYYIYQELNQQENGKYMPIYKNKLGQVANMDQKIIQQKIIEITCDFDHYLFIGLLTEQQIFETQKYLSIDELFDTLIETLKNEEEINTEERLINIKKNNINMELELEYKIQVKINIQKVNQTQLKWILERQDDKDVIEKKIKDLHFHINTTIQKHQTFVYQTQNEHSKNIKSHLQDLKIQLFQEVNQTFENQQNKQFEQIKLLINSKLQEQQNIIEVIQTKQTQLDNKLNQIEKLIMDKFESLENIVKEHQNLKQQNQDQVEMPFQQIKDQQSQKSIKNNNENDQKIVKPSDLIKTKGYFWIYPQQVTGEIKLQFKIKQLNQYGLVIGLDNNNIPIDNPAFCIYMTHQVVYCGKNIKKQLQYKPKIHDNIFFKVDMNQRIVVLQANELEITSFQLEDSEQSKLYLCVGYFNQSDHIQRFIE